MKVAEEAAGIADGGDLVQEEVHVITLIENIG